MSTRNFARVFRRDVKLTPAGFVDAARIDAARRMLADTTTPLQRIARACGFGNLNTMRRVFVRNLGVAPLDYRKSFRSAYADAGEARTRSRRANEADAPKPHQRRAGKTALAGAHGWQADGRVGAGGVPFWRSVAEVQAFRAVNTPASHAGDMRRATRRKHSAQEQEEKIRFVLAGPCGSWQTSLPSAGYNLLPDLRRECETFVENGRGDPGRDPPNPPNKHVRRHCRPTCARIAPLLMVRELSAQERSPSPRDSPTGHSTSPTRSSRAPCGPKAIVRAPGSAKEYEWAKVAGNATSAGTGFRMNTLRHRGR